MQVQPHSGTRTRSGRPIQAEVSTGQRPCVCALSVGGGKGGRPAHRSNEMETASLDRFSAFLTGRPFIFQVHTQVFVTARRGSLNTYDTLLFAGSAQVPVRRTQELAQPLFSGILFARGKEPNEK
jgi:hypothetical protein